MKKLFVFIILVALVVGAYYYLTRPVSTSVEQIESEGITILPAEEDNSTIYYISQNKTEVSYSADELLANKPFTAVGKTNKIAGEALIVRMPGKPVEIRISPIKIDARTFVTDDPQRDGAVSRFILKTETAGNEYITFTPTKINQPSLIEEGKQFNFSVEGDLTISGVTKPSVAIVSATEAGNQLSGTAKISFKRTDYGLTIPNIPFVANVSDTIPVTINFSALTTKDIKTEPVTLE